MGIEENKKVVLKLIESFSNTDLEGCLDVTAKDLTWWVIGSLPGISGTRNKQEWAKMTQYMFDSVAKTPMIVDHIIGEGDWVAAELHADGKTPKGKSYSQKYHFKFEVKDGKIRTVKEYNDTALIKDVILGG